MIPFPFEHEWILITVTSSKALIIIPSYELPSSKNGNALNQNLGARKLIEPLKPLLTRGNQKGVLWQHKNLPENQESDARTRLLINPYSVSWLLLPHYPP